MARDLVLTIRRQLPHGFERFFQELAHGERIRDLFCLRMEQISGEEFRETWVQSIYHELHDRRGGTLSRQLDSDPNSHQSSCRQGQIRA